MKVVVADKISDRGVQLLQEQPGWNIVLTTKDTLNAEIADADALIVRSATKVTAELLDRAKRMRAVGRAGVGAYDMGVLAYDRYVREAAAHEISVELVPLGKLLAESDFGSLHTALSPATQNLINAATIQKMKKGARLINTARGELIDEAALAD